MQTFDYSPKLNRTRRRRIRFAIAAIFVGVFGVLILKYGKVASHRVQFEYAWHKCSTLTLPPDKPIYEESWAESARLLKSSEYRAPVKILFAEEWYPHPPAGFVPPALYGSSFLPEIDRVLPNYAVTYLHERTTSEGTRALLLVRAGPGALGPNHIVDIDAFTLSRRPSTKVVASFEMDSDLFFNLVDDSRLKIFAGQSDAADPSRFTIRFSVNGEEGIIYGQLRDLPRARDNPSRTGAITVELRSEVRWQENHAGATVSSSPDFNIFRAKKRRGAIKHED
jgi:hypothetical protein